MGCANVIEVSQELSNKIMIHCMYYVNLLQLQLFHVIYLLCLGLDISSMIQNLALIFTVSQLLSGTAVLEHARKYANLFIVTT